MTDGTYGGMPPAPPPANPLINPRVNVPSRLEPRRIRNLILATLVNNVAVAQILAALGQDGVAFGTNHMTPVTAGVSVSGPGGMLQNLNYFFFGRTTTGEAEYNFGYLGALELIDPTGPPSKKTLIWDDHVQAVFTTTPFHGAIGFIDRLTSGDPTTVTGIGFQVDATGILHCIVKEAAAGYVAPVTTLLDVDTGLTVLDPTSPAATSSQNARRLALAFDGPSKTMFWYVDGVLVGQFSYQTAPGRLWGANGSIFRYIIFSVASAAAYWRFLWGSSPGLLRTIEQP